MNPSIHRHTPTLAAVDARRLPVRTIAYHRASADDSPQPRVNRQAYDTAGRVIAQWDPRLWALAQAETSVSANQTSVYSLSGQVLSSTSVDAGWRVNLPTESGQVLLGWDSRGSVSHLEYDALLRPIAVFEQAQGESERCVERLHYADASPEAAARNLCGQLVRHDDPAGSLVVHEASLSGGLLRQSRRFLVHETAPDWPVAEPQRDELLEPGDGALTSQQYSALGEPLQQTDAKGHRQRFIYDVAGQLHGTWLQLAGQAEQKLVSAIGYNAFGQVETETAGNGVISTTRYSPVDGRLEQLLARKTDGTRLQELTYTYDPVGNILSIWDDAQPVRHFNNQRIEPVSTYQYDTLYQLIEATGRESAAPSRGPALPGLQTTPVDPNQLANYTQNYSYDAGGNLTTLWHVGAQSYTHEMLVAAHSNRSIPKDEIDLAAAFDSNGNLQQLQPGQALTWDLRNQLRQVTPVERVEAANDDEVYVYDGGSQRVRKIRRTQAKNVMHRAEVRYLPGLELRTNTATGETLQVISVSAGRSGVRVLHWEAGQPDDLPNDQLRYSLSDHLGSSSLELDQQAQLISQEGYYPYGGTAWWAGRNATEAKYKTIRYSGKERDATGLYYYGFRYYAPWLNRWINPDPAGDIDGLNLYRMVGNNPISFVDEQGLMWKSVIKGVGGTAYAVYEYSRQRGKEGTPPPQPESARLVTPGERQADQWLSKSKEKNLSVMDKVTGAFRGRYEATAHIANGELPGAKAILNGAEVVSEAAQFAAHRDLSGIDKTSLAKSATVDAYNNLGNVITAAKKAAHTSAVVATIPTHKKNELTEEMSRRTDETATGLKVSIATGVAVAGTLDAAAMAIPIIPIKFTLMGASALWKVSGVAHTAEELSKIASEHKDLVSNELGKDVVNQIKTTNKQRREDVAKSFFNGSQN